MSLNRPVYFCPQDTLILGSVGSNSGRRFIQKILEEKQKQLKRNYPDMQMDYMGTQYKVIYLISDSESLLSNNSFFNLQY